VSTAFSAALRGIVRRVPEAEAVMLIGSDGIPVEKLVTRGDSGSEAVAAEVTALLRASRSGAEDTGLGALRELSLVTERTTTLLVAITPEYFLLASLGPRAMLGRARFALRLAALSLAGEFD
jgi:predicted regulator of Ras-like GTPase activity (Roadblock/LC7/MglB family)